MNRVLGVALRLTLGALWSPAACGPLSTYRATRPVAARLVGGAPNTPRGVAPCTWGRRDARRCGDTPAGIVVSVAGGSCKVLALASSHHRGSSAVGTRGLCVVVPWPGRIPHVSAQPRDTALATPAVEHRFDTARACLPPGG